MVFLCFSRVKILHTAPLTIILIIMLNDNLYISVTFGVDEEVSLNDVALLGRMTKICNYSKE